MREPMDRHDRPDFYGRRRHRPLRERRRRLIDRLLPRIRVDIPRTGEHDPATLFTPAPKRIWLEIGFGGGEHLADQATAHPEVGLIGCDPFIDGVGGLLRHVEERRLENVRILPDDVRLLLPHWREACLDRVYLLFPDPWPKRRHARRRFIQTETLDMLARLLKDRAELRIASDHMPYIAWTLIRTRAHRAFEWLAERPDDWRLPPGDWIRTRYEGKALARGDRCCYLRFRRRERRP